MSNYDRDSRVHRQGRGYTVTNRGTEYQVLPNQSLGWGIYSGRNLNLVQVAGRGLAIGYRSADEAIRVLIGNPR